MATPGCGQVAAVPGGRCAPGDLSPHGVVVAAVPWARHDVGHTYDFGQQVAWLATECSKSATAQLMRVAWRTVSAILTRYQADADAGIDRPAHLRRIGIDKISSARGRST